MSPDRTPLQPFLSPAGIVFFGASPQPGTLGSGLLTNLAESPHKDRLFLVSQKHTEIGGFRCHRQLDEINAPLTLALIATPANTVPGIVEACAQRGIGAAVIYSVACVRTHRPAKS